MSDSSNPLKRSWIARLLDALEGKRMGVPPFGEQVGGAVDPESESHRAQDRKPPVGDKAP